MANQTSSLIGADLSGLGGALLSVTAALPQALDQIARIGQSSKERANASAIERGIFQSSIRDTAVGDVEAQQASQTRNVAVISRWGCGS